MRGALIICLVSIFLSCRNDARNDILPPEKVEAVLLDYIMAEVHTNIQIPIDSASAAAKENARLQKKILTIHGVTKEQFSKSFDYYSKHTNEMTKILDSIISKENRRNAIPLKGLNYE